MKKLISFLVILHLYSFSLSAQSCLPEGITFYTQSQVDNFQTNHPNCTEIEGGVTIWGTAMLNNLNGLNILNSIGGNLYIHNNYELSTLSGLQNVSFLGGDLIIEDNSSLNNLEGLQGITSITGSLFIGVNPSMDSLSGLRKLTYIGGNLEIIQDDSLVNLKGLDKLSAIEGNMIIGRSYYTNQGNPSLVNFDGLQSLVAVGGDFEIYGNGALQNLYGLENLVSVGASVEIINNNALTELAGLDNLISIGGNLKLGHTKLQSGCEGNHLLSDLTALSNLTSIGGFLEIECNDTLSSLSGLDNIEANSIEGLSISGNSSLTECAVQSICDYLVSLNGVSDIGDNGQACNSPEEVEEACESLSIFEQLSDNLIIHPNPANQEFNISIEGYRINQVRIYTTSGQQIVPARSNSSTIDISYLNPGMYIVEVNVKDRLLRRKLLVQR